MEINALNESSAQFCMICLNMQSKLYPSSKHNLDMEYESLTGILLADAFAFTPMFCIECAQRLVNCCKLRDKSLRAFQLLSELVQSNAGLSLQTLSSVDRSRCQLTSSVVKKTFEPDHCDLYVTEDTESIDKVYMENADIDLQGNLYLKYETDCDLELKSGDICDDAAEFTADDDNTDVDMTSDDANDGVNVMYIGDASNDDLYNHEHNMHGVEQSNTNLKSHEKNSKIQNHNTTTSIRKKNADAKWLNDMDDDIDIDCYMKKDIPQTGNDVYRRGENVKSMAMTSNFKVDNKYILNEDGELNKCIAVGDDIVNKEGVEDENDELSDYYEEIGVISLDDDIGYNIHDECSNQAAENYSEYDNYVRFVKENISKPGSKGNGGETVANKTKNNNANTKVSLSNVMLVRETGKRSNLHKENGRKTVDNKTKNNDVDNIVSLNNVMLVREAGKRSVSNEPHATTHVSVKKRAAKRKQPPSDERKSPKQRSRKKTILPPQKLEEPKYKEIKWFRIIERSPEEQVADWAQRRESQRYREAPYKCTDCYNGFRVEKTYNLHMEKHTDKYGAIECLICRVRFRMRRFLTEHHRRTHKSNYRCTKCSFVTNFSETAIKHSQRHDGKTYECPHCGKVFTNPSTYFGHVRFAHPSDAVCALCGYSFIGKRGLWMHQNKAHRDDTQELSGPQCSQCNVRFASEAAYDTHLQVSPKHGAPGDLKRNDPSLGLLGKPELPGEERTWRRQRRADNTCIINCELCNALLENRIKYYWLFRHYHPDAIAIRKAKHPKPRNRDFMCEQCGKLCISNFHLQDHMLRHGSPKVKCDACDKKFYSPILLRLHVLRIHDTAQRRGNTYACAHCAYQTKDSHNFTRHTQIHMDSNARRWFHCSVCEKKTTTRLALQNHMRHVHEKVPWPARVRASRARAAAPRTRDTD